MLLFIKLLNFAGPMRKRTNTEYGEMTMRDLTLLLALIASEKPIVLLRGSSARRGDMRGNFSRLCKLVADPGK